MVLIYHVACSTTAMNSLCTATGFNCIHHLSSLFGLQDVATRVIAEGLRPEETSVSKVMTKNPVFVMGDTLAVEALQKMVQGAVCILCFDIKNGEFAACNSQFFGGYDLS